MTTETTIQKGAGFERVRLYVLGRCAETGIARITCEEIGAIAGISKQAASKHLKTLLEIGVLQKERQSVYSTPFRLNPAGENTSEPAVRLTGSLQEVDEKLTKCQPHVNPPTVQVDEKLTGSLQEVDEKLTKCPSLKNKDKDKEKEKTMGDFFVFEFWGGGQPGIDVSNGRLPPSADSVAGMLNWKSPIIQKALDFILDVFNVKEKNWSKELTRRLIFGLMFRLPGFDEQTLKELARKVREEQRLYEMFETARMSNPNLSHKDNPNRRHGWRVVAGHVTYWFEQVGIKWTHCEKSTKTKIIERFLPGFDEQIGMEERK